MAGERTVRISILGDAKGAVGALNETGSASEGLIGKLGSMGAIVGGVALAGVAALGALGVGAYQLGATFDDAYDTIRLGTGQTGEVLEGLQEDFKAVVSNVPTDFGTASTAIADLNTRLGLTGEPLQDLATQMLNLANISGKEVGPLIASTTRLFGDWSVATEDQAGTLDTLWKVSQNTGIGVDELAEKVVQFGAPLRQMGFSFEESAAMIGKWEAEGVNAELVLGSLRIALGNFARDGVTNTKEALQGYIEKIQEAGSTGEANAIAMEIFGAKAGPDMAAAIREGRFEIDDLLKILDESPETINGAAAATADLAESWTLLKNKAMVALEPIGNAVFGLASDLVKSLIPAMDKISAAMQVWGPRIAAVVTNVVGVFLQFGRYVGSAIGAVLDAFGKLRSGEITLAQFIGGIKSLIATVLGDLFGGAGGDFGAGKMIGTVVGVLRQALPIIWNELTILGRAFGDWIATVAVPWLQANLPIWLAALGEWLNGTALPAIWGFMQAVGQAFTGWLTTVAIPYLQANLPLWLTALGTWLSETALPAIGAFLLMVGQKFGTWVTESAIPFLQENIPLWLYALGQWVVETALPAIGEFLVTVGQAFGTWVTETAVPWLVEHIPEWLAALSDWYFNTAAPAIRAFLIEAGKEFGTWITETAVPYLQQHIPEWLAAMSAWITGTALPAIGEFLITIGKKFGTFVTETAIPYLQENIPLWLAALGDFLTNTALPAIGNKAKEIGLALVDKFMEEAGKLIGKAKTKMGEVPGAIQDGIGDLSNLLYNAGAALINGLISGIESKIQDAIDIVQRGIQKIRDLLPGSEPKDPSSPLRGLGEAGEAIIGNMADGLRLGLPDGLRTIRDVLGSFGGEIGSGLPGVGSEQASAWQKLTEQTVATIAAGLALWDQLRPYLDIPRLILSALHDEMVAVLGIGEDLFAQAEALRETAAYYANSMKEAARLFTEGQSFGNGIATLGLPSFDLGSGGGGGGASGGGGGTVINLNQPVYGVNHFADLLQVANRYNARRGG